MSLRENTHERAYARFATFTFNMRAGTLHENGRNVKLSSRASQVLTELIKRNGELVSKQDLLARVWPDNCVDENTLRVHIYSLRKHLRDCDGCGQIITTIPGRGYKFVPRVRFELFEEQGFPPSAGTLGIQCWHLRGQMIAEFTRQLDVILGGQH